MAGIEEILSVIESQADSNVQSIINEAENKAKLIRLNGEAEANNTYKKYIEKFKNSEENEYKNACSSIESEMKKKILYCKIDCINNAIEMAFNKITTLPVDEYFSLILKLVGEKMRKGHGIISFNANDIKRIPDRFQKDLDILTEIDNSSIKISPEPVNIENGFILSYGDISENCSFHEIFVSEKDSLRDIAASLLFA